jgi:hypothetical protein
VTLITRRLRHLTQAAPLVNEPSRYGRTVPPLRDHYLATPHPQRLPTHHRLFAEIVACHAAAVAAGQPCYADPATGLTVFTAAFLAERGYCCDSGCRHCPFIVD